MRTVLVIDDKPGVGEALALLLSLRDIHTLVATQPAEGLALLARQRVDLVIQDMNFSADTTSGDEGVALFRALREKAPDLPEAARPHKTASSARSKATPAVGWR